MTLQIANDPVVDLALRLSLAALFATAAFHKLRDPGTFTEALRNYRLLPRTITPAATVLLVASELAIVAALLAAPRSAAGAGGAAILLIAYSGAIGINLARGRRDVDCGCLGPRHRQTLSEWLLLRNGVAVAAALVMLAPDAARDLSWLDGLSVAASTATFALLWASADRLMATWPRLRLLKVTR